MTTQVKYQDRTVTANGLKIHYLEWGDPSAPPLVALHGLRGHGHTWDSFSEPLSSQYHIFALDQRGRGDTDWAPDGQYTGDAFVADFEGFVDALGLDNFVLMGHSMGGRNSMLFGSQYPEKLKQLVLVDVGPDLDPRGGNRIAQEVINVPEEFDTFEDLFTYMNKQNRFAPEPVIRRRLQYASKELPNGKFGWRYDQEIRESRRRGDVAPTLDLWPALPKITCPTLIVRGTETDLLSPQTAQRMVDTLPNGKLVEVEKSGHMVFEDNPDGFLEAVQPFLD
jgi:esterase